ncbi:MAG: hypothetical protein M1308_16830 [Actinobacteria bacterium]|nr:hypothetical protein [Actinomycetota bacterium]
MSLPAIPNLSLFIEKISRGHEALAESIIKMDNLNIDILQPPLTLHQSDKFDIDMLDCLIYLGRNNYNFIIADIPFRFDNICIEMLNLSTISLLVLDPNSGTIVRANEFKRLLPQYQKKGIIINYATKEQNYSIKDLKSLLDIPIFGQIPHICEKEICYLKYGMRNLKIVDLQSKILNLAGQII